MEEITKVVEKINIIEQERYENKKYFLRYIIDFCTENGFTSPKNALRFNEDFQTWYISPSFSDDVVDTAIKSIYVENGLLKGDVLAYYLGEERKDMPLYDELLDLDNLMDLIKNINEIMKIKSSYKIKVNDVCEVKLHDELYLLYDEETYPCIVNNTKTSDNIPMIDCDDLGIKELELEIINGVLSIWDEENYGLLNVFVSQEDCQEYVNTMN